MQYQFTEAKVVSPLPAQSFLWMAEYFSGGLLEYDKEKNRLNPFGMIQKEKLVRFGLVGQNRSMWYEAVGGNIRVANHNYGIAFVSNNGTRYSLAGNGAYRMTDCISYKQAYANIPFGAKGNGDVQSVICGYYFGYKTQIETEGVKFSFKPIFAMPLDKAAYFDISLVADQNLEGKFVITKDGKDFSETEAILLKGKATRIQWMIR